MTLMLLVLAESMSLWYPKTSKLGGQPKYNHDPGKAVPLGIMLKNVA